MERSRLRLARQPLPAQSIRTVVELVLVRLLAAQRCFKGSAGSLVHSRNSSVHSRNSSVYSHSCNSLVYSHSCNTTDNRSHNGGSIARFGLAGGRSQLQRDCSRASPIPAWT